MEYLNSQLLGKYSTKKKVSSKKKELIPKIKNGSNR
jgi:hypothetical protein